MYEEISKTPRASAAIWSKLTLGLLATITLELVPFRAYTLFPVLLLFF
jgi:hypothetical protein